MAAVKLASAGDDVKLWDVRAYKCVKQYNPHNENVSAVSWNADASWLASASSLDTKIALSCVKNGNTAVIHLDCEEGQTCVEYSSNSEYLLSAGISGTVKVWDLKTLKANKIFKDHTSTIMSACFNRNDTYIASGSEKGEIIIKNVVTSFGSSPLVVPKSQAVQQIRFKKSLLGAAYDSGLVCLWDSNTRRLLHMFSNAHRAPATGITFSPFNDMFMMTVGLDKRLVFYDIVSKITLNVIDTDSPLTAVDMMQDGSTIAVGSTRGKVTIYDLRQGSSPITVFTAHKSSVQSLKFQPGHKSSQSDVSKNKMKKLKKQHLLSPRDSSEFKTDKIASDATEPHSVNTNQSGTSTGVAEIFSPLREGCGHSFSLNMEMGDSAESNSSGRSHSVNLGNNSSLQNCAQNAVFSPLGRTSSLSHQSVQDVENSFHAVSPPQNVQPVVNGLATDDSQHCVPNSCVWPAERHNEAGLPGRPLGNNFEPTPASSNCVEHVGSDTIVVGAASDPHTPERTAQTRRRGSSPHHPLHSALTRRSTVSPGEARVGTSPISHIQNMVKDTVRTCNEHMLEEVKEMWRKANDKDVTSGEGGRSRQTESGTFQTEFILGIVEEQMEEFRDAIHRDVQTLQVEMIRQFQIQLADINSLLEQQFSVNRDLVGEVEQLRRENAKLRNYY